MISRVSSSLSDCSIAQQKYRLAYLQSNEQSIVLLGKTQITGDEANTWLKIKINYNPFFIYDLYI